MKWTVAGALLFGMSTLGLAQEPVPSQLSSNTARAAFELEIHAPEPVREVLQRHLELLRYRALSDLSDGELSRLLTAAELDTRELLGAMGYFSPDVRLARGGADGSALSRSVTLTVLPGAPTTVEQIDIAFAGAIAEDPAAQFNLHGHTPGHRPGQHDPRRLGGGPASPVIGSPETVQQGAVG